MSSTNKQGPESYSTEEMIELGLEEEDKLIALTNELSTLMYEKNLTLLEATMVSAALLQLAVDKSTDEMGLSHKQKLAYAMDFIVHFYRQVKIDWEEIKEH